MARQILRSTWLKVLLTLIWINMAYAIILGKTQKKLRTRLFFFAPFLYPKMYRSFWSKVSDEGYRDKSLYSPQHLIARGILKDVLSTISFNNLLEVGCGTGENLIFLKGLFPNVEFVGCDFSEKQIEKAKCYKGVNFNIADCRNLPYQDKSFDVVITVGCLAHIPSKYIKQCADEIQRVSKYGLIILEEDSHFAAPDLMLTQKMLGWFFYHDYMKMFGDFSVSYLGNNMPSRRVGLHTHLYVRKSPSLRVAI